jgi:hypothetical protein
LDQVPDTRVDDEAMELPPLARKPRTERFTGSIKPIRRRF